MAKATTGIHPDVKRAYLESAGYSKMPRKAETEALIRAACLALDRVDGLAAAGNKTAVQGIVELARRAVATLPSLACEQPEAVNEIAKRYTAWPILCNLTDVLPKHREGSLRWLRLLPLGEKSSWKIPNAKRPFGTRSGINLHVRSALGSIAWKRHNYAARLGKMPDTKAGIAISKLRDYDGSHASLKAWTDAVWLQLHSVYGPHPEKHPSLRSIGESHAKYKARKRMKSGRSLPLAYEYTATDYNKIRDRIRERIKGALRTLLNGEVTPKQASIK